jgi:cytochrome c-type biogenesis protein
LVVAVVAGTVYLAHLIPSSHADQASPPLAPDFTLPDIDGQNFTLSEYRNNTVVAVEFTALSCSECKIVEASLATLYSTYNHGGTNDLKIVSVFIEPQFGDSIPALKAHQAQDNVSWTMAQDTPGLLVSRSYGVSEIPTVVIVDKHGQVVYDVAGVQSTDQLKSTINSADAGTATAISIITVSVFALAAVAGVTTFFSPCAFPMFPGYMSLFLGLTAGGAKSRETPQGSYQGAVRRAVFAGSITAIGMIVVFLVIGVALILAASIVGSSIPYFMIIVGGTLIALGLLLLTNLDYWRLVRPLQALGRWIRGKKTEDSPVIPAPSAGRGFYLKLFGYGMGYAAAAAGCVAPVIFSAIIAGMALGLLGGIVNILIFSLTAAVLMIVVTVMLAVAGARFVNQLNAYTPVIKKISAVALVLVGVYLIYFFNAAFGL